MSIDLQHLVDRHAIARDAHEDIIRMMNKLIVSLDPSKVLQRVVNVLLNQSSQHERILSPYCKV